MAIAVDARQTGAQTLAASSTGTTSVSWTHTLGASLTNSILIVSCAQSAAANSTGVTWDDGASNLALTLKGSVAQGNTRAEIWYVVAPTPSGAKTIRVSWSGSHGGEGGSASYTGVDQSTIFNAASPQTSTGLAGTDGSLTVTTTNGEMAVDSCVFDLQQNTTGSPGKGASQSYIAAGINTTNNSIASGHSDFAATGTSVTMTWTHPTPAAFPPWGQVGVSLLVASAAAAAYTWNIRLDEPEIANGVIY